MTRGPRKELPTDMSLNDGLGLPRTVALALVKRFNRLLCHVKSRRYRSLIRSKRFSSELPPAERVMILAPHMDDEAIGCAGLIARYANLGARVVCVYLTDGAGGRTGNKRIARIAERMQETRVACLLLGIEQIYFLNQPDGRLAPTPALIDKLQSIVAREVPQLLLLPYPCDPHPDHHVTASITARTLRRFPSDTTILYYQLRAPIPLDEIDLAIDIGNIFTAKRALLYGYRSQPRHIFDLALHLQQCQGVLLDHNPLAVEVFSSADLNEVPESDDGEPPFQITRHRQAWRYALHRSQRRGD